MHSWPTVHHTAQCTTPRSAPHSAPHRTVHGTVHHTVQCTTPHSAPHSAPHHTVHRTVHHPAAGRSASCEKLNIRAVHRGLTVSSHAAVPSVQFGSVTPTPLLVWSGPQWATPASLPRWCETDGGRRPETWSTVCRRDDTQRPCCWTAVCASAASAAPSSGRLVQPIEHMTKGAVYCHNYWLAACKFKIRSLTSRGCCWRCRCVWVRGYRHSLWDVFLVMDTGLSYWCGLLCVRPGNTVNLSSSSLLWSPNQTHFIEQTQIPVHNSYLLGCAPGSSGRCVAVFRSSIVPSSSGL